MALSGLFERMSRGEQVPSLRLESISQLNGIEHESAHDALSDVYATIAVAKLIRDKQSKMYEYVLSARDKKSVSDALALGSGKPRLHISSKFGASNASASLILPVLADPRNRNEIHCVDLRHSPSVLIDYDAGELADMRFLPAHDLPDPIVRFPLKSVHLNKCPIVLPPAMVTEEVATRCNIDIATCEEHRKMLLGYPDLQKKLLKMLSYVEDRPFAPVAEAQLYAGFIGHSDRALCQRVPSMDGEMLASTNLVFEDERLKELLFRYRARNFPESLSASAGSEWKEWVATKISENSTFIERQLCLAKELLDPVNCESSERIRVAKSFEEYYRNLVS